MAFRLEYVQTSLPLVNEDLPIHDEVKAISLLALLNDLCARRVNSFLGNVSDAA
jgi:hypothetical protein